MRTNKVQKEDSNENNYQRYGGGMRMDGLLFAIGVTALAWVIALLFHIPFELIALVGCIGCALFTIFTSF